MDNAQRDYWNTDVGSTWAQESDALDAMLDPLGRLALDALNVQQDERVVDIGCGAGATTRALAARGAIAVGVDLSEPLLAKARTRACDGADYVLADAGVDALPGPFDAAYSRFGVMFFPEPVAAFAHLRAQMRSGGRLAFVCWGPMAENSWATAPLAAILPLLPRAPEPIDPHAPGPFAFAEPGRAVAILRDAGWRNADARAWRGPYSIGESAEAAAELTLKIGPLGRALRDQPQLRQSARDTLLNLFTRQFPQSLVQFDASVWIITADA